ncbi:MAG: hypothetical protein H6719_25450 [Sandaracinaceae bacterium]|nr:hypothetical protein [Sandaracinaceae bacterium]
MRWSLVALGCLAAAPASAQCAVAGRLSAVEVRVDVADGAPLEVDLEEQAATVSLTDGPRVSFESAGDLEFRGSFERGQLRTRLARSTRVGPLRLRPGTEIRDATAAGMAVAVEVELMEGVTTTVELPCRAVELGATAEPPTVVPNGTRRGDLLTTGRTLRVHVAPGGADSIVLVLPAEPVRFAEAERRHGWVRVRRDFFDGSTLDGWVRERGVRSVPSEELTETLWGTEIGMSGGCGRGATHTYRGPATLRAGAVVRTEPDGPSWARARRDMEVQVFWRWGATWVALEGVEGLRSRSECPSYFEQAHVQLDDVVIPGVRPAP